MPIAPHTRRLLIRPSPLLTYNSSATLPARLSFLHLCPVDQPSGGDNESGSDASLSSESEGDDGDGGGGSHLALLENFFPTLADSLRRHLEVFFWGGKGGRREM